MMANDSEPGQQRKRLRSIPSMEKILSTVEFRELAARFGRSRVKEVARSILDRVRLEPESRDFSIPDAAAEIERALAETLGGLRRVINGTGVLIHTNLGRAPISRAIWESAGTLMDAYTDLELDLESGQRGSRNDHISAVAAELFGAEAALLVNNNAAAVMLVLAAIAAGREVIVSRGELVEIGGSFRVPDVIRQGGAKLREVGTTNRTRASDYEDAVSRRTAAILVVHRSNFQIVGFTESPAIEEVVEVARARKVPLVYDEGAGRVVDLAKYGFERSQTLSQTLRAGVDVVTCSTDKLIGSVQGGLILGRRAILERVASHPLMRALRVGKESYAVTVATLRAFIAERQEEEIALYRTLAISLDELRSRALKMTEGLPLKVVESQSTLGGGTTPTELIPSIAVAAKGAVTRFQKTLLGNVPPLLGRIHNDRFLVDLRTVDPADDPAVRDALGKMLT
ncbi:MAG TPA: L-seryl-tRNA(Sec) selenium transferase [Thermoanaerobaculia bacterium]|nr:L-seryl-tRNA(Sec) selenium transferase [Thermoanaerobaculia bacterium]